MTSTVRIEVPAGADYQVEVKIGHPSGLQLETFYVKPGGMSIRHIYRAYEIHSIREVPLTVEENATK